MCRFHKPYPKFYTLDDPYCLTAIPDEKPVNILAEATKTLPVNGKGIKLW